MKWNRVRVLSKTQLIYGTKSPPSPPTSEVRGGGTGGGVGGEVRGGYGGTEEVGGGVREGGTAGMNGGEYGGFDGAHIGRCIHKAVHTKGGL